MPTRYTTPIYEGEKISFQEFIWRCARETTALEFMDGQPLDAEIPTHIEVDTSLLDEAKEALAELEKLQALTGKQVLAIAEKQHQAALKDHREREEKARKVRKVYENLLEQAEAWVPPADTYQGLKHFMVSELAEAIAVDCSEEPPPAPPTDLDAFHNGLVLRQTEVLLRLVQGYYETVFKAFGQEEWIKGLRNAVPLKEK